MLTKKNEQTKNESFIGMSYTIYDSVFLIVCVVYFIVLQTNVGTQYIEEVGKKWVPRATTFHEILSTICPQIAVTGTV